MKALVYNGPRDVRYENVPDPSPGERTGAIVRVDQTAICGSDLHIYHGDLEPTPGYTIGHEAVGEVVEVGSGVNRFAVGDRVLMSGVAGCGSCFPCREGSVSACDHGSVVFGTNQGLGGAQAEAIAVPVADTTLFPIPEDVSVEEAVLLTDILPTGYLGARDADIRPGGDVAIVGMGPVGLMALQCASLFGPARIFALDSVPERLAEAERLGAVACDVSDGGVERIMDATGGLGVHSVIEAVGSDAAIQGALGLARAGGTVSVVGVTTNLAFPFPMALALVKGLTFRIAVCSVPEMWPRLVPLVQSGRLQPGSVFTHRMGLSEGAAAYDLFDSRRDGVLKVLLDATA